jgi:dipeptidyl-peptidase-4
MRFPPPWIALLPAFAAACSPVPAASPLPHAPATAAQPIAAAAPLDQRPPILGPEASAVSFDRLAKISEPGWHVPRAFAYSPDGKLLTYLMSEAQDEHMALFAFDLQTKRSSVLLRASDLVKGDKPVSREEELRRERQRKRIQGVTAYAWARRAPALLVPMGGDVFVRTAAGAITRLTETPAPEIDPQICDGAEKVAFVRDGELFVVDVATRRETQLTKGAPEGVTRGLSDFNGQEEFGEPSGFWLSPGCDRLAYLEVDERPVPIHPIVGFRGGKPDLMQQRYPAAGEKNPAVRVGILDLKTQRTVWLKGPVAAEPKPGAKGGAPRLNDGAPGRLTAPSAPNPAASGERYLGRFRWSPDGKALWLQTLDREQKRLALVRADPATGAVAEVLVETSPTWIDFGDQRLLERSPRFVWTTMQGARRHLEVRDAATGARLAGLTSGAWDVDVLHAVDEERGRVLFTASRESPLEAHLYAVPLAGGEPARLTRDPGDHKIFARRDGSGYVDLHSAIDRPPKVEVRGADGAALGSLAIPPDPEIAALRIRPPELVSFRGPSGDTLHGALLRPRTIEPGKRYPVVVMVYGGPGAQAVRNAWYPRLLWQHLADRGFVVFQVDNRGTGGRGQAFQDLIYGRLGDLELADQVAGVEHLKTLPFVDGDRVGIYGHSYGGYMATLALLKAPETFRAGVAGSPVTDWRLYDTGWTERYMGLPSMNGTGYEASNLNRMAAGLRGKLLIIHALMDENVHFQHTAELIDALVAADRPFDLLIFPGERHGYRSLPARRYVKRRVVDYFVEHL